ncbi:MAG: helix-turn-helix domain-containing protein [Vulcanimicrobiaceae bacterium]
MRHIRNVSDIGTAIRERRQEVGRTIDDIASAVGIDRTTLYRIETGRANPTWEIVLGIGQALDLQPALIPRQHVRAVEAVLQTQDATEAPPLIGEEW